MRQPRGAAWPVDKPGFYLTEADAPPAPPGEGDVQGGGVMAGHRRPQSPSWGMPGIERAAAQVAQAAANQWLVLKGIGHFPPREAPETAADPRVRHLS